MTLWLLDTNVLSELRRLKPSRDVLTFVETQELETLHISAVTIAEIRYGIVLQTNAAKHDDLERWLETKIRPMFYGRIIPVSEDVMLAWRIIIGKGRKQNRTFAQPDLILAATALHHGMTIVSRDTKGFASTEVPLVNPWLGKP